MLGTKMLGAKSNRVAKHEPSNASAKRPSNERCLPPW
jgi:hypothetical protein